MTPTGGSIWTGPNSSPSVGSHLSPPDATSKRPPVRGSLPYTAEDYEKLPIGKRSMLLDFLILGKFPASFTGVTSSPQNRPFDFDFLFKECLLQGEMDALDFLWKASGFTPNGNRPLSVLLQKADASAFTRLSEHCRAHEGIRLELNVIDIQPSAVPALIDLIEQGQVYELNFGDRELDPADLTSLAGVMHCIQDKLQLYGMTFDIHSERALAESLVRTGSLKTLSLEKCDLGPSLGMQFVEGMQKNQSIAFLKMSATPLPVSLNTGYAVMLSKNTSLEDLRVTADAITPVDMDSILIGALSHPALRSVTVKSEYRRCVMKDLSNLTRLLEKNCVLNKLDLCLFIQHNDEYALMADAISQNTSMMEFKVVCEPRYRSSGDPLKPIEDTLARNRALATGQIQIAAGHAFDPTAGVGQGMSDAGSVIANYVLEESNSLDQFADTMAAVELSMRELARQMPANSPANGGATSPAGSATTTTTTTTATQPDAASS